MDNKQVISETLGMKTLEALRNDPIEIAAWQRLVSASSTFTNLLQKNFIDKQYKTTFNKMPLKQRDMLLKSILDATKEEEMDKLQGIINTENLIERQDRYRLVLIATEKYEKAINEFLNRKIHFTYVDEDGQLLFLTSKQTDQLYAKASAGTNRGSLTAANVRSIVGKKAFGDQLKKYMGGLDEELRDKVQKSIQMRQGVYKVAYARFKAKDSESQSRFYFYLQGHRAYTGKITGGEISEGYANAVLNDDKDIMGTLADTNPNIESPQSPVIENSLKELWVNYIQGKKDNIFAILKGDVVMGDDIAEAFAKGETSLQFAMKGTDSFSTATIYQYINFAYNIKRLDKMGYGFNPETLLAQRGGKFLFFDQLARNSEETEKIFKRVKKRTFDEILKYIETNRRKNSTEGDL